MHYGKYQKKVPARKHRTKSKTLLVCLALLLCLSIGGTMAYVITGSRSVNNQFDPAQVSCAVSNGKVTNTSDVKVYLRASVIANWVDADGNIVIKQDAPSFTVASGWTSDENGIYYYGSVVEVGEEVTFVSECEEGASIEIAAEAIQAEGMGADNATEAWAAANAGN